MEATPLTEELYTELFNKHQALKRTHADAQATVEALQARVKELEGITKVICGHYCEPMEIPSKAVLQSQLTQRTAELHETQNHLADADNEVEQLRKQLSEHTAELEAAKQQLSAAQDTILRTYTASAALDLVGVKAELERVRNQYEELLAMVAALPKMEGEIRVYSRSVMSTDAEYLLTLSDEREAQAYAALLQHRQGMEG